MTQCPRPHHGMGPTAASVSLRVVGEGGGTGSMGLREGINGDLGGGAGSQKGRPQQREIVHQELLQKVGKGLLCGRGKVYDG
jgi:hypothetical protein